GVRWQAPRTPEWLNPNPHVPGTLKREPRLTRAGGSTATNERRSAWPLADSFARDPRSFANRPRPCGWRALLRDAGATFAPPSQRRRTLSWGAGKAARLKAQGVPR